jgi:zinc/manganese transport system substrate-binding protein
VLAAEVPSLDDEAFRDDAAAYVAGLRQLDAEVEATLAVVPPDRRTLVTTHDVLGYLADRYGFEVIGTVVDSPTTQAAASGRAIDELAAAVEEAGAPAVFADASAPDDLADALADEVGGMSVVELYTESLGEAGSGADTYEGMVRTNADRIAGALAP